MSSFQASSSVSYMSYKEFSDLLVCLHSLYIDISVHMKIYEYTYLYAHIYIHIHTYMSFSFIDYIFPPVIYYAPTKQKNIFLRKILKTKLMWKTKKMSKLSRELLMVFSSLRLSYILLLLHQ